MTTSKVYYISGTLLIVQDGPKKMPHYIRTLRIQKLLISKVSKFYSMEWLLMSTPRCTPRWDFLLPNLVSLVLESLDNRYPVSLELQNWKILHTTNLFLKEFLVKQWLLSLDMKAKVQGVSEKNVDCQTKAGNQEYFGKFESFKNFCFHVYAQKSLFYQEFL